MSESGNAATAIGEGHAGAGSGASAPPSPFDPLSPAELHSTSALVRGDDRFHSQIRFAAALPIEPSKAELARSGGEQASRRVEVLLLDDRERCAYRLELDLGTGEIEQWKTLVGLQPGITLDEVIGVERECKSDQRVLDALRKRGLSDEEIERVNVDPWSAGNFGVAEESERRIARGVFYLRESEEDNAYAHPIDGLATVVDLHELKVLAVEDRELLPVPRESANYAARFQEEWRSDLKPLEITQPEGPSFTVEGWKVSWQKWSFQVGFNQREGLTLHRVTYRDEGVDRPVLHRASVAEMTVPYGDPAFVQHRKNAFDVGEYGLGAMANSLERGCDCLGEIHYFDTSLIDGAGDAVPMPNAICLHEEDAGILWKHFDFRTDKTEVRRARRLVISFIATVGNYEYAFYWYFGQDGSIEFEVKATGVVQTGTLRDGGSTPFGTKIGENLYGPHHQHFFCIRLDTSVDGLANQVTEVDTVAEADAEANPIGNAFAVARHTFEKESEAQRLVDPLRARAWLIENSERTNELGSRTAYKLIPGENCLPFAREDSSIARRAGYMSKHLWVTRSSADERFPAGEFPNQHMGGEGLPQWTQADRPIKGEDIVVWYVMGHHHIVRPEDWPVMPVARLGFALKPNGFFTSNPALDVPPPDPHCDGCET